MANLNKIHIRTGCFCNPGACQRHLRLSDQEILINFEAGHVCGDTVDLINGKPTGSVRISFGYMSTKKDADVLLTMIKECFIENNGEETKHFSEDRGGLLEPINHTRKLNDKKSLAKPSTISSELGLPLSSTGACMEENKIQECVSHSNVYLSHMFLYPVKSCGAFQVKRWHIGPRGLLYDRQWMIVAANGVCVTQKMAPSLCMIHPMIDLENGVLLLNYSGMPEISIPLIAVSQTSSFNSTICHSKVCGNKVQVLDCGDAVAEWLTAAIQDPSLGKLRLHSQYCASDEITKTKHVNNSSSQINARSLSNQAQFLLINYASVQWLLQSVDRDMDDSPCDEEEMISRFRCNFVVTGAEKLTENKWNKVKIGDITFQSQGPCTRCQIICINQATGKKTKEPLKTIARVFEGKIKFGIYLSSENSLQTNHTISIGDSLDYTRNTPEIE